MPDLTTNVLYYGDNLDILRRYLDTNVLYYGDNPDILRRYLPDAAVDLVYLDPRNATDAQLLTFENRFRRGGRNE